MRFFTHVCPKANSLAVLRRLCAGYRVCRPRLFLAQSLREYRNGAGHLRKFRLLPDYSANQRNVHPATRSYDRPLRLTRPQGKIKLSTVARIVH